MSKQHSSYFQHTGQTKSTLLNWAVPLVEEALKLDPTYMNEVVQKLFGCEVFCWSADYCTPKKIHALCRAALFVRLSA